MEPEVDKEATVSQNFESREASEQCRAGSFEVRDCGEEDKQRYGEISEEEEEEEESKAEMEEEDDEDADFDPFLGSSPSLEASSGLSSENENLEEEGERTAVESCEDQNPGFCSVLLESESNDEEENEGEEENERDDFEEENCCSAVERQDLRLDMPGLCKPEDTAFQAFNGNVETDLEDRDSDDERMEEELMRRTFASLSGLKSPRQEKFGFESEKEEEVDDAICKRTRAHLSLADMSLDELETFLQESDEEDYFQNVDDEEEYRKFLAAVKGKLEGDAGQIEQGGGKDGEEDDDEDDYDFEIEIEEALESDYEDILQRDAQKRKRRESSYKSEAREKRRQRSRSRNKERPLGLGTFPLRPLLPSITNANSAEREKMMLERLAQARSSNIRRKPAVYGFTSHQIGQLYCLIHEHVQLLVQVLSLCILEPSRQQIAIETHRLLMEIVKVWEQSLLWKRTAYPDSYFHPPYIHPSVSEETSNQPMMRDPITCQKLNSSHPSLSCQPVSHQIVDGSNVSYTQNCVNAEIPLNLQSTGTTSGSMVHSPVHLSPALECSVGASVPHLSHNPTEKLAWVPAISGPICTIWDIAPLAFVGEFLADMAHVAHEHRQRHIESGAYHGSCEREPLFPFSACDQDMTDLKKPTKVGGPVLGSAGPTMEQYAPSAPQPQIKKTMAATLVENTKKQCLALVPKAITLAIQRFFPIFNAALFPHKPPPASTANRLLFTDAEDELLAMGLMTFNTDWEAIQQRFLPSKTTHQIFVRQKNRSSGRAPENSIKAVRRMKSSPLTVEEMSCIEEGLKLFKFDWIKIWQHCVPHRDPAILPRQWRVAVGAQKTFKHTETSKEKYKTYDASSRQSKSTKNKNIAFPETTNEVLQFQDRPLLSSNSSCEQIQTGDKSRFLIQQLSPSQICPSFPISSGCSSTAAMDFRPLLFRRKNGGQTVKLAPGLPSLDLPPTVRVISQSNLGKSCQLQFSKGAFLVSHRGLQQDARVETSGSKIYSVSASSKNSFHPEVVSDAMFSPHLLSAERMMLVKCNDKKICSTADRNDRGDILDQRILSSSQVASDNTQAILQEPITNEQLPHDAEVQMHPLLMQQMFDSAGPPDQNISFEVSHNAVSSSQYLQSFQLQQIPKFHPYFRAPKGNVLGLQQLAFRSGSHQFAFRPAPIRPSKIFAGSLSEFHPFLLEDRGKLSLSSQLNNLGSEQPHGSQFSSFPDSPADTRLIESNPILKPEAEHISQQQTLKQMKFLGTNMTGSSVRHTCKQIDGIDKTRMRKTSNIGKDSIRKHVHFENDLLHGLEQRLIQTVSIKGNEDGGTGMKKVKPTKIPSRRGTKKSESSSSILKSTAHQTRSKRKLCHNSTGKGNEKSSFHADLSDSERNEINTNIVMEQEELSDSDEKIEVVQFEYEEMGDSDREGLQCDLSSELEKEDDSIEFEEEDIFSDNSDDAKEDVDILGGQETANMDPEKCSKFVTLHADREMGEYSNRDILIPYGLSKHKMRDMDAGMRIEFTEKNVGKGNGMSLRLDPGEQGQIDWSVVPRCASECGEATQGQEQELEHDLAPHNELTGKMIGACDASGSETIGKPAQHLINCPIEKQGMIDSEQPGCCIESNVITPTDSCLNSGLDRQVCNGLICGEHDQIAVAAAQVLTGIHQNS